MGIDIIQIAGPINKLAWALLIMMIAGSICTYIVGYLLNRIKAPSIIFNLGITIAALFSILGALVLLEKINFI